MRLKTIFFEQQKTITAAALLLGASALVSRVLGVLRERLLVSTFGVGDATDAYYASFQTPNILMNLLILGGTFSAAFVPVFTDLWRKNKTRAFETANAILGTLVALMGACAILMFFLAPALVHYVIAPGFVGEKLDLTVRLTRIMLVSPILFTASSVFYGILNVYRRFLVVALAPILYNLGIICGIIFLAPRFGIYGVAAGVLVGAVIQGLIQLLVSLETGYRFRPRFDLKVPGVKLFFKLFFPRIWGISTYEVALIIGTIIGSTLAVGSVALFNLAANIEIVAVGVFGIPFAIAAFPVLAGAIAAGKREEFVMTLSAAARQILFFLLPAGLMMIVLRAHLVRLIIGARGVSWDETRLAAAALAIFAATLALQGLTVLLARAFYALKSTWLPVIISTVAIVMLVIVAKVFVAVFAADDSASALVRSVFRLDGIADIRLLALPTGFAAATILQTIALVVMLRRRFGQLDGKRITVAFVKIGIASIFAALFTYGGLYLAEAYASGRTFFGLLIQSAVAATLGLVGFFATAFALRTEEAIVFVASLRRKLLRITPDESVGDASPPTA